MRTCDVCAFPATVVCRCARCDREDDDEKFWACDEHVAEIGHRHARVRGRAFAPDGISAAEK